MSSKEFRCNILYMMANIKNNEPNPPLFQAHIKPIFLVLFVLLLAALKIGTVFLLPRPTVYASDLTIENILSGVNNERSQRNLTTLNTNSILSEAAQSKTDDMQARHYFAHVDPDGNYIWVKIVADGYTPYLQLGENLAIEFYDTESLMAAWMNSPTHRANILNDGFKDQGMGITFGNSQAGQYHSAIANTFGTLLVKKVQAVTLPVQTSAPQPAPQPAVKSSPKKTTAPAPPQTAQMPAASSSEPSKSSSTTPSESASSTQTLPVNSSTPVYPPIAIRGENLTPNNQPLAQQQPASSTLSPEEQTQKALSASKPQPPIITEAQNADTNRYLILAFGICLMLFLLNDLRQIFSKEWEIIDKKINNLVVLIIAIVAIALMYWL